MISTYKAEHQYMSRYIKIIELILKKELKPDDQLPSVRALQRVRLS